MHYAISNFGYNPNHYLTITEEQYNNILQAHDLMSKIIDTEEIFDFLMENYFEIEKEMLTIAQRNLIFGHNSSFHINERGQINRRLINFLSTARLYLDHASGRLSELYGDNSVEFNEFKLARSRAYDTKFGYRVLEALRNHSQHHGYPIHFLNLGSAWKNSNQSSSNQYTADALIDVAELAKNKKFHPKKTLKEMQAVKGEIRLKNLLRQYIDGIGDVHDKLRDHIAEKQQWSISEIEIARRMYVDEFSDKIEDKIIYLVLINFEDPMKIFHACDIVDDGLQMLRFLQNKNRNISNISTRYVSSEIVER